MIMQYAVISLVSFIAGIAVGYFGRSVVDAKIKTDSRTTASNFVLFVVTIIWALSVVEEAINPAYHTNPLIHGLMGVIAGYYFKPFPKNDGEKPTDSNTNL